MGFHLYTIVNGPQFPQPTYSDVAPFLCAGDKVWGHGVQIPVQYAAFTIDRLATLQTYGTDSYLAQFSDINLDGEYSDAGTALSETQQIRAFIDSYNQRSGRAILFSAYYPLSILDAGPTLVQYPDITFVGKTNWDTPSGIVANAPHYLSLISQAGRTPGIHITNAVAVAGQKNPLTSAQVEALFAAIWSLGVAYVGYTYTSGQDQELVDTLNYYRPNGACTGGGPTGTPVCGSGGGGGGVGGGVGGAGSSALPLILGGLVIAGLVAVAVAAESRSS